MDKSDRISAEMEKDIDDTGQFKMRLEDLNEEVDSQAIPMEINELKLEKISQRVTLISIIIPVLIVVVLVITYLDIKKRVVHTEDVGTSEVQKLSSDLESRFSSLSVKQARLEEDLVRMADQSNHAMAQLQVRLEKLQDSIKAIDAAAADKKQLNATKEELAKRLNAVIDSANTSSEQIAAITTALKAQMDQVLVSNTAVNEKISAMDTQLEQIENTKIDKPALDLAIRLEGLKVENDLKSQIEALQAKVKALEAGLAAASKQTPPASAPAATTPPKPSPSGSASDSGIKEQTIPK